MKIPLARYESLTRDDVFYSWEYDDNHKTSACNCPGSRYYHHCKHTKMIKEGKYPKDKIILTIMGAAKSPELAKFYRVVK